MLRKNENASGDELSVFDISDEKLRWKREWIWKEWRFDVTIKTKEIANHRNVRKTFLEILARLLTPDRIVGEFFHAMSNSSELNSSYDISKHFSIMLSTHYTIFQTQMLAFYHIY